MKKTLALNLTQTRYRNPRTTIVQSVEQLNKNKFTNPASGTGNETILFDRNGATLDQTGIPSVVIQIDSTWTIDDVGSNQTVEEYLPQSGNSFIPTLPVRFFRNVWYDGIEAYFTDHYTVDLGIGTLSPNTPLIPGTRVLGRYVVK